MCDTVLEQVAWECSHRLTGSRSTWLPANLRADKYARQGATPEDRGACPRNPFLVGPGGKRCQRLGRGHKTIGEKPSGKFEIAAELAGC